MRSIAQNNESYFNLYNGLFDVKNKNMTYKKYIEMLDTELNNGFPIDYVPIKEIYTGPDLEYIYEAKQTLLTATIHPDCYINYDFPYQYLDRGADPNYANSQGWTPLFLLAQQCDRAPVLLVQKIIDRTRDINLKDNQGNTALDWAATSVMYFGIGGLHEMNARKIIAALVKAGANDINFDALGTMHKAHGASKKRELREFIEHLQKQKENMRSDNNPSYEYEL